jgi:hypothetical protein
MKFKSRCKCGIPFLEHNRHVGEQGIEDCKPTDNLEYLEWCLEKKEKFQRSNNETPR